MLFLHQSDETFSGHILLGGFHSAGGDCPHQRRLQFPGSAVHRVDVPPRRIGSQVLFPEGEGRQGHGLRHVGNPGRGNASVPDCSLHHPHFPGEPAGLGPGMAGHSPHPDESRFYRHHPDSPGGRQLLLRILDGPEAPLPAGSHYVHIGPETGDAPA